MFMMSYRYSTTKKSKKAKTKLHGAALASTLRVTTKPYQKQRQPLESPCTMSCARHYLTRDVATRTYHGRILPTFATRRMALSRMSTTTRSNRHAASFSTSSAAPSASATPSSPSSSTTNDSNENIATTATTSTSNTLMNDPRQALLEAALVQVPEHGWTRQAIVAAVPLAFPGASLSMAGQITPQDMVAFCMDQWNQQLYKDLTTTTDPKLSIAQALQRRLEYQVPLVQCGRWQQAMAMGLHTPQQTSQQLQTLIHTVLSHAAAPSSSMTQHPPSTIAQLALGGIYVATELHLLADTSPHYQDTWQFLQQRVQEWENTTTGSSSSAALSFLPNPAMASTVASALASGVTSVLFHNIPTTGTTISKMDGTDPRHYQTTPKSPEQQEPGESTQQP